MSFPERNITNYPLALKRFYQELAPPDKNNVLMLHQYLLIKYFAKNPKHRGLLIMHQTGTGKTLTAIAIAEQYKEFEPNRRIIVLAAKSLISNFRESIMKYYHLQHKKTERAMDNYKFVSLNAGNMYSQLYHATLSEQQRQLEKGFGEFIEKVNFLDNTLIIVDEAHHIFTSITNGSKNGIRFYDAIMKAKNIKLIFLTGTPIINDPFELVPCFNMLSGNVVIHNKYRTTLFPENREEFYNYFVDSENMTIKNASRFENRAIGLTSYFGEIYLGDVKREGFPEQYPTIVVKVHMSNKQYASYSEAREMELEELTFVKKSDRGRFSSKGEQLSTYRVKSRQISNFYMPEHALGKREGRKSRVKHIGRITMDDIKKLDIYSPKMKAIMDNIKSFNGLPGVIYSSFTAGEGLGIFEMVLRYNGYTKFNEDGPKKKYALITGDISIKERDNVMALYNDPENMHGELIELLLISGAGSEGLDVHYGRHIHIMEPFWNIARIEQVIARIVRYKSHELLPAKERNVQPFIYLSDYPKDFDLSRATEETTDVYIYKSALKKKELINDFILSIVESSVDCHAYYEGLDEKVKSKIHCKICNPNNQRLFHPNIQQEFLMGDPCEKYDEEQIIAKEIIIPDTDEKFYYTLDEVDGAPKITIFEYNENLGGYTTMRPNNPHYGALINLVIDSIQTDSSY